jgi:hypothetical protein
MLGLRRAQREFRRVQRELHPHRRALEHHPEDLLGRLDRETAKANQLVADFAPELADVRRMWQREMQYAAIDRSFDDAGRRRMARASGPRHRRAPGRRPVRRRGSRRAAGIRTGQDPGDPDDEQDDVDAADWPLPKGGGP